MIPLIVSWMVSFTFSLGVSAVIFVVMRKVAEKPWKLNVNSDYKPIVSIIVPTYNEGEVIQFKLDNLVKVNYPKNLLQIVVVDSNSQDHTVEIIRNFIKGHPETSIQLISQNERKGKSSALNFALRSCRGDVIVVSDADCFWPFDILEKTLPFLADPSVGAISGPKVLLNSEQTWVTRSENAYLSSMNLLKLGESKTCSTLFFEGGFSVFKKEALLCFDPYNTGSDDCGTVINLIENGYRALLIPEAFFYSSFPSSWKGRLAIKIRRANQLVRVLWKYFNLLLKGNIKGSKRIVVQAIFLYLVSPLMFVICVALSFILLLSYPYLALLFLLLLVPLVRFYLFEIAQNYTVLMLSLLTVLFNKKFVVWNKPPDRSLIHLKVLQEHGLI